jgi:hypothetical protein
MDTMAELETRVALENLLDADGEYYIGAEPGDGTDAHFRGPTTAEDAIANAIGWARSAFAGKEAMLATRDGDDYPVVATLTAGGPGTPPKIAGGRRKAKAESKPAPKAEAKPVEAPAKKRATRKPSTS